MERYVEGIKYAAGNLMIGYKVLSEHIDPNPIRLQPGDRVNVFINFESILYNVIQQRQLSDLVNFHKQKMVIELEAAILNLVAHYRVFFLKSGIKPKIYFYHTDLGDEKQQMRLYNKFYRAYYHNRYLENPQYRLAGQTLQKIIIPEIELILSYVPGCYFLKSKTFDGSLIPQIVSTFDDSKNLIITADIFDTQYLFNPNFITLYLRGRFGTRSVISTIDDVVQSIIKNENPFDLTIFRSELYYKLLLAVRGSKIRNIKASTGFSYGRFLRLMKEGIEKDIVLRDFASIDSIIEMFPDKLREEIKQAFQCSDFNLQSSLLSETDIDGIRSQLIDKLDRASLEALNNKRFLEFPINLQGLLE